MRFSACGKMAAVGSKPTAFEELVKQREKALAAACRRRGVRFVFESPFVVDDVYVALVRQRHWPTSPAGQVWQVGIKPLAVDDVVRASFLVDEPFGARALLNRRVNCSSFDVVDPLRIGDDIVVPHSDGPDPGWDSLLGQFDQIRAEFVAEHPTVDQFLTAVRAADDLERPENVLRETTALIALGRLQEAAAVVDAALATTSRHTWGRISRHNVTLFEYLSAYAHGPDAWQQFRDRVVPTHSLRIVQEKTDVVLNRPRNPSWTSVMKVGDVGRLRTELHRLDGVNDWALILIPHQGFGKPRSVDNRYMQAAGTAAAMTVEIRQPGGSEWDQRPAVVSVRSIVGRGNGDQDLATSDAPLPPTDISIELPGSTQHRYRREIFTADEAAELFEHYFRTGELAEGFTLRPDQGFTATGAIVVPPNRLLPQSPC